MTLTPLSRLARSLKLNTMQEATWFSLGCAAMRIDDFARSVRAFRRKVEIDEDVRSATGGRAPRWSIARRDLSVSGRKRDQAKEKATSERESEERVCEYVCG